MLTRKKKKYEVELKCFIKLDRTEKRLLVQISVIIAQLPRMNYPSPSLYNTAKCKHSDSS